ncbi:hypothetical protein SDC9_190375 [bioreactor metagenome]|uniref:Uncharacterized protein n=1 Tax=bioreactor metagenome TaxID=1076179 RepID=A0A645HV10_9ZZZZ
MYQSLLNVPQGLRQTFLVHGLHDIVQRIRPECLQRISRIRGHEDDVGILCTVLQLHAEIDAVNPPHFDIEENNVRGFFQYKV